MSTAAQQHKTENLLISYSGSIDRTINTQVYFTIFVEFYAQITDNTTHSAEGTTPSRMPWTDKYVSREHITMKQIVQNCEASCLMASTILLPAKFIC